MFLATKCNKFKKTKPYQVSFPVTAAAAAKVTSVVSNSVRPHRRQPTRLLRPWDFPGKSTGVGCHCLLLSSHDGSHFEIYPENSVILNKACLQEKLSY